MTCNTTEVGAYEIHRRKRGRIGSGNVCSSGEQTAVVGRGCRHLRLKHYSLRTEKAYVGWIRRHFGQWQMTSTGDGVAEVEGFISSLAVQGQVTASTQNQALSALLFLYREVLSVELLWLDGMMRVERP